MLDIEQIRAEIPGVDRLIHLNNAGASLAPRAVLEAVAAHQRLETEIGAYEAAELAGARIARVYASVARLIHARPREIAVVENATRAWDMAFYSLPLEAGDIVLTSTSEYAGNYIPYLQARRRRGIVIDVLPNDAGGTVSLAALAEKLDNPHVKLISLPAIATNGGPLQPLAEIGALARQAGVLYLLDACQAVGQMPIDVRRIGCHFMTATSRKYLRGPRGVGFLYVEEDICRRIEPVFLDLHAAALRSANEYDIRPDARRFENWECNVAAKLGLGAAADGALALGMDAVWARIRRLARHLRAGLRAVPGVALRDPDSADTGIVTFTANLAADAVRRALAARHRRINVSVSNAASTLLDMSARGLPEVVRASVHAYNTEAELDEFLLALAQLTGARR